jgi:hypothetical protein
MHARVNYRQIPPGKMDEAVRTYREVTGPNHRPQPPGPAGVPAGLDPDQPGHRQNGDHQSLGVGR